MIVRAKTKRRVLILVGLVVVLGAAAIGVFITGKKRSARFYAEMRTTGLEAFAKGDYPGALEKLARYVRRDPDDAEVLYRLVQAMEELEMHTGQLGLLQRVVKLDPRNTEARRLLMDMQWEYRYYTEAYDTATEFLKSNPNDATALRVRALAASRLRNPAALELANQCLAVNPFDLQVQVEVLHYYQTRQEEHNIIPYAEIQYNKYPDDGRFELLLAMAYSGASDWDPEQRKFAQSLVKKLAPDLKYEEFTRNVAVKALVQSAAKRNQSDLFFAEKLVAELEFQGLAGESISFLQRAQEGRGTGRLHRLLVHRLWQNSRFQEVVETLGQLSAESPTADAELLTLRAISLAELERKEEAKAIADALGKRKDAASLAWASILREQVLTQGDALLCAQAIHAAIEGQTAAARRRDIYLRYFLARCYITLGESERATQLLQQVFDADRSWLWPALWLSRLYLEAGERTHAAFVAEAVLRRAPEKGNLYYATNLAVVVSTVIDFENSVQVAELMDVVSQIQRLAPGEEQTLPTYVKLLAHLNKRDEAVRVARSAIENKKVPGADVLIRLAAVSREASLGLEKAIFDHCEKAHGNSPDLTFAQAVDLRAKGNATEALRLIEESEAKDGKKDYRWRLGRARYLEEQNDVRATAAWIELADDPAMKDNLVVQRAALKAMSVQGDRDFRSRTIERVRARTGEYATDWRIAKAALHLQDPAKEGPDLAIALLKDVLEIIPSSPVARQQMAAALLRKGDTNGAIAQLNILARTEVGATTAALGLARLYQAQGDQARAKEQLDKLEKFDLRKLGAAQKREVVALLARQGDTEAALRLVDTGNVFAGDDEMLVRFELLRSSGEMQKAEDLLAVMLKKPSLSAIVAGADFYAARGQKDNGDAVMAMLSKLELSAGVREFAQGYYLSRHGTVNQAIEKLEAATKAAPDKPAFALALMREYVRGGRVIDALNVGERAAKAAPENSKLSALLKHAALLREVSEDRELWPLVLAVIVDGADSDVAVEAIRLLAQAKRDGTPAAMVLTRLQPLADRAVRVIPLQRIVIDKLLTEKRFDEAVTVASRCMEQSPNNPELARLSAEVFAASNNLDRAIDVGEQWRQIISKSPLPADLFLAEMHLRKKDPARAAAQLRSHVAAARSSPESYFGVIALQARALLGQRKAEEAADLVWPLTGTGVKWRALWLGLAPDVSADVAKIAPWIERVMPLVPADSFPEHVTVANAWYVAGHQFKHAPYMDRARSLLDELVSRPGATGQVLMARAMIHERDGQVEAAEAAYRRAIISDPALFVAQNNLAMILIRRGAAAAEAVELATKAVQAQPNNASLYDTLALAQAMGKDYKAAAVNLRQAARLEPDNLKWQVNLANVLVQGGSSREAAAVLERIDSVLPLMREVPLDLQKRIDALRTQVRERSSAASVQ